MKQKLSFGSKCECNCHGREGTIEYCGYCTNSHRKMFTGNRSRR